jgi:hypothetical protein
MVTNPPIQVINQIVRLVPKAKMTRWREGWRIKEGIPRKNAVMTDEGEEDVRHPV